MNTKTAVAVVIILIAVGAVSSVATYYLTLPPPPKKLDKVILALGWTAYGENALIYPGIEFGYYEDEGILLTVVRGYGAGDTINKVGTGTATFGWTGISSLPVHRALGVEVTAVGVGMHRNPDGIIAPAANGITTPKDLEGRKLIGSVGQTTYVLFPAFADKNGIDVGTIEFVEVSPPLQVSTLQSGQGDAICSYYSSFMGFAATQTPPIEVSILRYADFGMEWYGTGFIASDELIRDNPDLIRRFLRATYKSYDYAIEHPDESLDFFLRYWPELSKDRERLTLLDTIDLNAEVIDAGMKGLDFGKFDPDKVKFMNDVVVEFMGVENPEPWENLYTNEFLE
jgi:NitT/TauT family transport system substrate-binding protein